MKIFFGMLYQDRTAEGSCLWLFSSTNTRRTWLIFMNKVQVYGEKEKIKCKEIGDFADPVFHSADLFGLVD